MNDQKTIVNSWNEWDPLKHVIVGKADGTCIPAPEPALDAKVPEDSDMRGQFGPRIKDTVDKANQLLDDFASLLEKKGIKVDRPTPIDFNQKTSTPDWEAQTMFGCIGVDQPRVDRIATNTLSGCLGSNGLGKADHTPFCCRVSAACGHADECRDR